MLRKPDGWIYGHNPQIAVDDAHQVTVATTLSADPDRHGPPWSM